MKLLVTVLATALTAQIAGAQTDPSWGGAPDVPALPDPHNRPYQSKQREWPDGPNKQFLQGLQRPDNHKNLHRDENSRSCCDAGDVVKTKFMVEPAGTPELGDYPEDRWYAWLNNKWVMVPPDKIVPDYAPDGQAYLFMLANTIVCFVRPKGGL